MSIPANVNWSPRPVCVDVPARSTCLQMTCCRACRSAVLLVKLLRDADPEGPSTQ